MAVYDYAAVSDAAIAFKKFITIQIGRALRDNLIAAFAGLTGAPRLEPGALDMFQGRIALAGTTGVGIVNLETPDLTPFQALMLPMVITAGGAGSPLLQVRFSDDNGAVWGAWQNLFGAIPTGVTVAGQLFIDLKTGKSLGFVGDAANAFTQTATLTIPGTGANGIQFRWSAGAGTGTIDAFAIGTYS